jgi:hypothetical protein
MDPMQLEMMQDLIQPGIIPGMLPGMFAPASAGASNLSAMANPANPYTPYGSLSRGIPAGTPFQDVSALAPLNLQQYGVGGVLAGIVGNEYMNRTLAGQGLIPMGNAGSYRQAQQTRQYSAMQQRVHQQLATQDADSIYRTLRGGAALAGMPFNEQQRAAAQALSQDIASFSPVLARMAPGLLDDLAGEKGSVLALSTQMMEANRYRVDPRTGRMGYSTESNRDSAKEVFDTMFSKDNMARMQGLRAGEVGQMYRELAAEGLAGTTGNLRERTIGALQSARDSGVNLAELGAGAGVKMSADTNLQSLSNEDLSKLRKNEGIQAKLTQADTRQITDRLQSYVGSIAAMREVFGENGDPNAPMPKLINSLRALTSGQMQAFDGARLNTMVRDVQAMSQVSGKSVDQLVAMNQAANQANANALGPTYGRYGVQFDHTSTKLGVAAGMSMAQLGGATGFGALNRQQVEQTAQQQYANSLNSEMFNALGAVTRLEQAGGFAENEAGREMKAALAAIDAKAENYTYTDDNGKSVTKQVPTRESEFRAIISRGAAKGVSASDFNMMLSDRTSNLRSMAETPERQDAVQAQQANEVNRRISLSVANRFSGSESLAQIKDTAQRRNVGAALSEAALTATENLTLEQLQDSKQRNSIIADAIKAEAKTKGLNLSDAEALQMAATSFGSREQALQFYYNTDATGYAQTNSKRVRENIEEQRSNVAIQAKINQAMSGLGPKGSGLNRAVTALQRQGDLGEEADIPTLLGDIFGAGPDLDSSELSPRLVKIRDRNKGIEEKRVQLASASPADKARLLNEIDKEIAELRKDVTAARDFSNSAGLTDVDNLFNRADINNANRAGRELTTLSRNDQVRALTKYSEITAADINAASDTKLTDQDYLTLGAIENKKALERADELAQGDIENLPKEAQERYATLIANGLSESAAREQIRQGFRAGVGSAEAQAANLKSKLGNNVTVGDLSGDVERQREIIRGRRANTELVPTFDQAAARREEMRKDSKAKPRLTAAEYKQLSAKDRKAYDEYEQNMLQQAESQLLAENQLKALGLFGEKDSLMASKDTILGMEKLDPKFREELAAATPRERSEIVAKYLAKEQAELFYGKDEQDIEQKRINARNQAGTAAGKRSAQKIESNIQALSELRREFASDDKAVARGGEAAVQAIAKSRQAEEDLRLQANAYFGGDVGLMLSNKAAMTDAGVARAKKEFAALSDNEKVAIAQRLKAAGRNNVDSTKLTEQDYKFYLSLRADDAVKVMADTPAALAAAANKENDSPEFKALTPEQITERANKTGIQEERKKDLGLESLNVIATAFGAKDDKEKQDIKQQLAGKGYNTKANLSMIAKSLKHLEGVGDKDTLSINKLDKLTDEFYAADTEEKRENLAKKYKMTSSDLSRMMAQTSILGLRDSDKELTLAEFNKKLAEVGERDVAKDVERNEARTMRLNGTVKIVGDINGQATFSDVTGITG